MRLRLFRVSGDSMHPAFHDGDYVVTWRTQRLKTGDVITVDHPQFGHLIKRVASVLPASSEFVLTLQGDNQECSTRSEALGPVNIDQVFGKVVLHIKQPVPDRKKLKLPSPVKSL